MTTERWTGRFDKKLHTQTSLIGTGAGHRQVKMATIPFGGVLSGGRVILLSMKTIFVEEELAAARVARWHEEERRVDELASLSAHVSAATARFVELAWELREFAGGDLARFLAYRCGVTVREARELLRVAEALQELPVTRAAFARGEVTFSKVRALTRVATASSEERLLELAGLMTASQLERALRVFRRLTAQEARDAHELEFVSYHFEEDGSLVLRARLAAEDGTMLVRALDAARERVLARRREERRHVGDDVVAQVEVAQRAPVPPRALGVEALLELAQASVVASGEQEAVARVVVHVDAAALTCDAGGRSELEHGPVIAPETARRLGCDAELVAQVERDGLPLSVGRTRRTVPPALRRLLEARDETTCCFPGCDRRCHLQAHHRRHWAHGGETSLDNLVLLCFHHHRVVHEGGYTIEDSPAGGLRFRNRSGLVCETRAPRPPPGSTEQLIAANERLGLEIGPRTDRHRCGDALRLDYAIPVIANIAGPPDDT